MFWMFYVATQTDQALLSVNGVARPADLLVSGGSLKLASVLKTERNLETAAGQKTLANLTNHPGMSSFLLYVEIKLYVL